MRSVTVFAYAFVLVSCSESVLPAQETPASCCEVTLNVSVPEGTGTLYLAGNLPQLGPWRPDGMAMSGAGRIRTGTLTIPMGHDFEYKFTLGTWDREAVTYAGVVPPNHRMTIDGDITVSHEIPDFKKDPLEYFEDWEGSGVLGTLVYWTDVESAHLDPSRHVEVWLPPGYEDNPDMRYPVLYMSDGQNLFDPRIANTGVDWGVDEAMMRLVEEGTIEPAIVVGSWSTSDRFIEYSPWHGAEGYAQFLIQELIPRVNAEFRTLTGPQNTYHAGSSMGGLVSYYLVTRHPEVFGACGCLSTHFPLSEAVVAQMFPNVPTSGAPDTVPYVIRDIEGGLEAPPGIRFWFDHGTLNLDSQYGPTHAAVRAWLLGEGLAEGTDFVVREYQGADHNEASWRARFDDVLEFLYGG